MRRWATFEKGTPSRKKRVAKPPVYGETYDSGVAKTKRKATSRPRFHGIRLAPLLLPGSPAA